MISIKNRLKSLLPQYVVESYPKFVDFLAAYCEWIEQQDNPAGYIRNLKDNLDIDLSIDEFVNDFKEEILPFIPESALADKRLYLKYVKDIQQTKGSEQSLKLLYRLLYNESIEVYYPKNDILRISDGKWIKDEIHLYVTNKGNPTNFYENASIEQTRELGGGVTETAFGLISGVREIVSEGYKYIRLSVTDVVGAFKKDWRVKIAGEYEEFIYPIVGNLKIDAGGTGYSTNDVISWPSNSKTFNITGTINHNKLFDLKITTTLSASDLSVKVDGVATTDFTFDGRRVTLANFSEGQTVSVDLPGSQGLAIVSVVGGSGEIQEIMVIDSPIGYNLAHTVTVTSNNGTGASLSSVQAEYVTIPGRYRNHDGHLSSDKYLRDGEFYQEYSYVIKAGRSLESYADVFKKLVHPGGMKMFGEINIFDVISLSISVNDLSKAIFSINGIGQTRSLGPVLASIETFKNYYKKDSYNLKVFDDMTSGEIESSPGKGTDLESPPTIQFLFDGVDVDEAMVAADSLYNISMFYMPNHVEEFEVKYPVWPIV